MHPSSCDRTKDGPDVPNRVPGHRSSDHQTVTAIALEAQRQARKAAVDLAILGGVNDECLVAQILHGLEHSRIALGNDDRTVDPDAVCAVRLVLGTTILLYWAKSGLSMNSPETSMLLSSM